MVKNFVVKVKTAQFFFVGPLDCFQMNKSENYQADYEMEFFGFTGDANYFTILIDINLQ